MTSQPKDKLAQFLGHDLPGALSGLSLLLEAELETSEHRDLVLAQLDLYRSLSRHFRLSRLLDSGDVNLHFLEVALRRVSLECECEFRSELVQNRARELRVDLRLIQVLTESLIEPCRKEREPRTIQLRQEGLSIVVEFDLPSSPSGPTTSRELRRLLEDNTRRALSRLGWKRLQERNLFQIQSSKGSRQ